MILVVRRILLTLSLAVTKLSLGFSEEDGVASSTAVEDDVKKSALVVNVDLAIVQFGEVHACAEMHGKPSVTNELYTIRPDTNIPLKRISYNSDVPLKRMTSQV